MKIKLILRPINFKQLFFTLVFVFLFIFPDIATAQEGFVPCVGTECNACHLVEMGNTILNWLIGVLFVIFAVVLAVAGWGLVTSAGNQSALNDAKSKFTNAFIGLMIVLGAWLLVDTIMRSLIAPVETSGRTYTAAGTMKGFGPWSQVECVTPRVVEWDETQVEEFTGDHGEFSSAVGTSTGPIVGGGTRCSDETDSMVVPVPGEGRHRLLPSAANNYVAMRSAAAAEGINLSLSSSYRSQATQLEIWNRKNCDVENCSGRVAKPCSKGGNGSNHSSGVAIDISGSVCGSAKFNWLKANGGRFGFYNKLGCRDPYHWSPSGR